MTINCMRQGVHSAKQHIPSHLWNPNFHCSIPTSLTLGPVHVSILLRFEARLLGKCFPTFRRNVLTLYSRGLSPWNTQLNIAYVLKPSLFKIYFNIIFLSTALSFLSKFSHAFSSNLRVWYISSINHCVWSLTIFLVWSMSISTHHLTFSILEWNLNNWILKETVYSKVMTVAMMEIIIYIYKRWFKYDRDWFVCKQAALPICCATLREWSHKLHPPSCSS